MSSISTAPRSTTSESPRTNRPSRTTASRSTPAKADPKPAARPKPQDQASLAREAGVAPNSNRLPNFQSWAAPGGGNQAVKPLSGDTLARNGRGAMVENLQQHLNQGGAGLEVDGKFGDKTLAAVKKFQQQHGLEVDGKVGKKTMAALNQSKSDGGASKPAAEAPKIQALNKTSSAPRSNAPQEKQPPAKALEASGRGQESSAPAKPADPARVGGEHKGPEKLPAGSYNAAQIKPEQLQSLKQSKDPKDRALAQTIERAQGAYKDMIKNGSQIIANRNAGNGGNPVLTILPPGFDPQKEARVHTHYHGMRSTVADPKGHPHGLTQRMEEIQKKGGPQTVFVLPESPDPQAGNWNQVKSQAETTNEALKAAGVNNPGYRVVSAHSAGGQALSKSIGARPDGRGLQADRLEMLDSLYGSEGPVAGWAKTDGGRAAKSIVYYHGTNNHSDAGIRGAFRDRYHRFEIPGDHNRTNTMMDVYPD